MISLAQLRIKDYWENRASDTESDEAIITLPDRNQRALEISVVLKYLSRHQDVLDIGCGNGFSTNVFSSVSRRVIGIDYSEKMIDRARSVYGGIGNISFMVRDVLDLNSIEETFDVAISQRCLINIPSWELQQRAILNIAGILKPGGVFLLQEGSLQGRENLNQTRQIFGLERMPIVDYNLDFDEGKLWPFVRQHFDIIDIRRFGHYDFISRVIHPLMVSPEQPRYDSKINEIGALISEQLRGMDQVSRQFLAILRRPESSIDTSIEASV